MQLENKIHSKASVLGDVMSLISAPFMMERIIPLPAGPARLELETLVWEGLDEAARRQGRPVADLCWELDETRPHEVELGTAIRTFVLGYYRTAAE